LPRSIGLTLILVGALTMIIGILIYGGLLSWFGRLPGDIRIVTGSVKVYIPITTMILISIILSLISLIMRRFF